MARIFSVVISTRILALFLSETLLLFCCYLAGTLFDPHVEDPATFLLYDGGVIRIAIATTVVVLGFYLRDLYARLLIRNRLVLLQELGLVFGVAFIVQGLVYYLDRELIVPRRTMIFGSAMALVAVAGLRLLFHFAGKLDAIAPARVLFLGLSPTVRYVADHLKRHPEFGLDPIGYLAEGDEANSGDLKRLGSLDDLYDVLDHYAPNALVIGRRDEIRPSWTSEFLELRFGDLRTEEAAALYERTFGRICVPEIRPSRVIFADSLEPDPADTALQTAFSLALVAVTLPITLPFGLLLALAVAFSTGGRVVESETRVGLNGRPFRLCRFRCTDRTGGLTRLGKGLRQSGLDALPQLWNIVRGDLALVGPAPERPEFARRLAEAIPFYPQRQRVKPGITGWAQIHSEFRDKDAIRELEYDLYYVRNLSPLMNLMVMFLSLKSFLLFRGSIES